LFTNLTNWLRPIAKKPLRRGPRTLSSRIEELEDRRVLDGAYYSLFNNSGVFQQDWTNTNLITANGDWSSVPSILGFNGAGLAPTPGTNPGTIQGAGGVNILTANQSNPGTSSDSGLAPGGIVEFELSNPTIALAGDTTNQAPYLLLHMDTRNAGDVSVSYLIRDIDASSRSTLSPVALQYRVSPDGNFAGINFINVGSQYKADVTSGSGSKADTPVTVTLPNTVNDRQFVQIRIMTANAVSANSGNPDVPDEWIGIDDIEVRGNLQPVVGIASGEVEYLENAAITFVDAGMNLTDIDSNDFNGGKLVVSYGTGPGYTQGTADDRLIVNNQGVGTGNISTTGTIATGLSIQYTTVNGTATIGTANINGGVGINSLVVNFTSAEATPTAVRQLLRNIGFLNTSDDPIGGLRKIQFTVSDGDSSTGQTSISVSRDIDVVPVNDEPVVSLDAPIVIAENAAPVILSPNAIITDPDSHDYDGGTLTVFIPPASKPTAFDQITILDQQGQGTGLVGVQNGNEVTYSGILIGTFTGGTNGTPLVITFNAASNPTPQSIQAVARAIQFENTSDDPPTSPRPVRFIAFDNDADIYNTGISANSQVTVTIQATNDAPVVTPTVASISYTENQAATPIDAGLVVADPDSANFANGTLTASYDSGGTADDRLSIRNQGIAPGQVSVNGNIVSYTFVTLPVVVANVTGSGVGTTALQVTFTPSATLEAVTAVLRNLSYRNVSDNPSTTQRVVNVVLNDGDGGNSPLVSYAIDVTSVNDGPGLGGLPASLTYEAGFPATVLAPAATALDPDNTTFAGGNFTVTITAGGLPGDILGIRNQGSGLNRIGIDGSNVTFSGVTIGSFTGGTGGAPLVVSLQGTATNAALQGLAQSITFRTPNGTGVAGPRTVQFSALDFSGGAASNLPTMIVDVISNAGPNDDFYETNEDTPFSISAANGVLANDPNVAQLVAVTTPEIAPTKGTLVLNANGSFTYTPFLNENGNDTFTYRWNNATLSATGTALVTIIINPVNDFPTATFAAASIAVNEDSAAFSQSAFATMGPGGGTDEATQTLTRTVTNNNNSLFTAQPTIDSSGRLSFAPAPNANGSATVSLTLQDSGGTFGNVLDDDTETYTFTITINAVNDIPTFQIVGNPPTIPEDSGPQSIANFALNFLPGPVGATDEAGQAPTYLITATGGSGDLTFSAAPAIDAAGTLTFTPTANTNGTANFIVQVRDNGGTLNGGVNTSAGKTFTITVGAVADPPTLGADSATVLWNSQDNPIAVLANDSGLPDLNETVTVTAVGTPTNGTVTIQPGGTGVIYTPTPGFTGSATFTYTATDSGGTSATTTVTVDVVQYQTQPVDVVAVGVGPGNGSKVRLYNAKTGAFIGGFSAYGPDFQGGVSVAMADINGDGVTDLVVGAGPGGGPHIQVIDGNRFGLLQGLDQIAPPSAMLGNFFGYDFAYRGGVTVAAGDVNGDGKADIILGTGPGGGAHVKIISGAGIQNIGGDYQPVASSILASFLAYDADFRGGVTVATGDMNRDGYFDVLAAAGPGGSSHVKAFSGRKLFEQGPDSLGVLLASFYGYDPNFRGGATVAAGDFNGDGYDDYIVGAGAGGGPHVKVFSPFDLATPIASFFAFEGTMDGGISVGYRMRSGGSTPVLVAGTGSGTHTRVATFAPPNFVQDDTADVFDPLFLGGVDVG